MPSARWMTWSGSCAHCELDVAAHEVVEHQRALARHLQAHDALAPLGLEAGAVVGGRRPSSVRLYWNCRFSVSAALRSASISSARGVVAVGVAAGEQLVDGRLVARAALRLEVGRVRAADLGPFVPVDAQPAEAVEDRRQRRLDVALLVGVVDAQDELAAVPAREQPVEQRRAHAADVQEARSGWARSACADAWHHAIFVSGLGRRRRRRVEA